jgi:cytochrome P450
MEHKPLEFLYEQFTAYLEDRRREPRDDVMTGLATATFPDGTLPPVHDVMRIAANLFSAGGETTARLMSTSFRILGDRPDLHGALRAAPDQIPAFIEEALRLEPPITGEFRLAKVPVTVGDLEVAPGTSVFVLNGAANRDPRQFDDPLEFRLDRTNGRQHIGFGHGIHSCAGAPLARAETRVTIERFLALTDDIRISEAHHGPRGARRYEYDPTYMLRGLRELHLEFTPAGRESGRV